MPFARLFEEIRVPVTPVASDLYREIGVRSHGKGVFHKEAVSGESLGDKRVFRCQPGALVFNIVFAWEQAVAVLTEHEKDFIASHRFPMFKGRAGQALEDYTLLFFKTRRGKELLSIASPGGAGRNKTLGQKELESLPIPCPTFAEQRAISELLKLWDKAIRALEQKIETKQNLRKGMSAALLSDRFRLHGYSKPKITSRLGDLGVFSKGIGLSKSNLSSKGLPCIRYGEIYTTHRFLVKEFKSFINPALAATSTRIMMNDLLFAGSGETAEEIGKCVAFMQKTEAYAGGDVIILSVQATKGRADYLAYYLNTIGRRALNALGQGQSIVHIVPKHLSNITIPLPSLDEQRVIAEILSEADAEVEALERKLVLLKEQKRFLLNNLVTGAIRLPQFRRKGGRHD